MKLLVFRIYQYRKQERKIYVVVDHRWREPIQLKTNLVKTKCKYFTSECTQMIFEN